MKNTSVPYFLIIKRYWVRLAAVSVTWYVSFVENLRLLLTVPLGSFMTSSLIPLDCTRPPSLAVLCQPPLLLPSPLAGVLSSSAYDVHLSPSHPNLTCLQLVLYAWHTNWRIRRRLAWSKIHHDNRTTFTSPVRIHHVRPLYYP